MHLNLSRAVYAACLVCLLAIIPGQATPTIQVIYPRSGAEIEGSVNLRVFAYEGLIQTQTSQIDTVKFFRKADSAVKISLIRIASSGEWSGVWNAAGLTSGLDTLVFRAINSGAATRTDSSIVVTIVSNGTVALPTVEITSPTAGGIISGLQTIAFTATAGAGTIANREISVDGGAYLVTSAASSHALNTVPLTEGSHTVRIRITNTNGAAMESRIVSYFVVNSPTVSWLSPAGGIVAGGRLIFNYDATPMGQATIVSDSLWLDGQGYAVLNLPDGPDTLDIFSLAEGAHTFQVKTTDNAGKTGFSKEVTLLVRNGPWVTITSPLGNAKVSGKVALAYHDSTVVLATVASDSLLVNGKGYQGLSLSGVDTLNSSVFLDGEYTLQVKSTDSHGHVGYSSLITVLIRNNPSASIDSLLADSTVSGTLVLRFSVSAVAPATVAQRLVSIDGAGFRVTSGTSTDSLDTRKLSEGAHTAEVKAIDSQGKEAYSRLVKFNIRNAPNVSIQSPAVDVFVRGIVTVRFTASAVSPDTIARTEISIGGGDWMSTTTDSTYTLDTRLFKDGDLRIQVRAIDGNGKAAQTLAREFVIDNTAPKISYPGVVYPDNAPSARKGTQIFVTAQGLDLGSGMAKDSAMVLVFPDFSSGPMIMLDNGQGGDKVAGDNVYTKSLDIDVDKSGKVNFTVTGSDALGNSHVVTATLTLDNISPVLSFILEPAPGNIVGSVSGVVYVSRILMQGAFADSGGAGMKSLSLVVRNDSGDHVNNSPEVIPLLDGMFRRVVELVPGPNRLYLIGMDQAGNLDTVSGLVTYVVPKETQVVTGSGGAVIAPDGSGVSVPVGVLDRAREITVTVVDKSLEPKPLDDNVRLMGVPHEFGPDGLTFSSPVTLTLPYTSADMDPNQDGTPDFDESKLTIVFWNGASWIKAGDAKIDMLHKTVSVAVNHFTLFDIAEDVSPQASKVVAFWVRNPVPGSSDFIFKVPSTGQISLYLLDMGGDIVKTLIQPGTSVSATGSVRWDGSNVRGRFAGAGLYVYVFKYKSDDGKVEKLIRKPVGLVGK